MSGRWAMSNARGFSLLETVAALAVLAVALAASMRVVGEYARNASYLKERTLAHWVAMNQATEWRLRHEWPEPGMRQGMERMADRDWHWRVLISTTQEETVRRLEVLVRPEEGETTQPLARLESYLAKPEEVKK
ncbi:MAG: type II secretion system minor pseudopilin GspI [Magnetococcales bacterium]|nr:type II secretion system minor pseudopilin GspI [Magnetococcales bacterium]